ncbi:hypothetical protein CDEST_09386 [Colletotrichum destructivum]|uniref:Uncharacterized protein n=1 Tax=Colletotrichum destructivum TaxID=34406 RepID=A0AAX4ILW5_9PEZI|nr:hypothetical protein CDEST_09386 [Colletotrichum destructivum]
MAMYMDKTRSNWGFRSCDVTSNINAWVMEALALSPAGMPANSFSLIFDGQPTPQLATQIFQSVVQQDVTWQLAWEESVRRSILAKPPPIHGDASTTLYSYYTFQYLPRAMKDIADQKSVVRCNFDVGEPSNVEKMVQDHKDWDDEQWHWGKFTNHDQKEWDTVPPLPSWRSILMENLVPIPDGPYVPYSDSDYDAGTDSDW